MEDVFTAEGAEKPRIIDKAFDSRLSQPTRRLGGKTILREYFRIHLGEERMMQTANHFGGVVLLDHERQINF